jgi:hypothetical protein
VFTTAGFGARVDGNEHAFDFCLVHAEGV